MSDEDWSQVSPDMTGEQSRDPRPLPANVEDRISRLASRRARAACALCRWRKVRCDSENERPCSNCVFENVDCVVPPKQGRRKVHTRKPYPGPPASLANAVPEYPTTPAESALKQAETVTGEDQAHPTIDFPFDSNNAGNSEEVSGLDDVPPTAGSTHSQPKGSKEFNWYTAATQSVPSPLSPEASIGLSASGLSLSEVDKSTHSKSLPSWLTPIPAHISAEDIDYLRRKGALLVPEQELRDELLKNYIQFVHPGLPLLDLGAFQASLQDPSRHGPISLLLFQAVMFAGAAWADIKMVRRLGYWTRVAIRRAFYTKAKVLYDLSYERDRLVLVQALTILTIWWDGPTEQKDGYYYCSLALAVARSIGLHRGVHNQSLSPSLRKLRRRVWWSCLIRDTITSLGGNRGPRTTDSDYNLSELTLEDFDLQEPSSIQTPWSPSRDATSQRQLANIFIWQSKLCRIISRVLELAYDENPIGHTGILYPRQDSDAIGERCPATQSASALALEKLEGCEDELRRWREDVPEDVLHQSPSPILDSPHEQAPYVHRALLSMLYHVTVFSLYRPHVRAAKKTKAVTNSRDGPSRSPHQMMRYAAACGNKIVMELYQVDLMRCLPATGISCILAISFSHVFDLQSDEDQTRRDGTRKLEECKQALRELTDAHSAAEWAIKFLTSAAAYVTRISSMRRRNIPLNQNVDPREAGNQNLPSQQGIRGSSTQEDVNLTIEVGGSSTLITSDSNQDSEPQPWQHATDGIPMEDNYRIASNYTFALADETMDYPNFPDIWFGGIGDPFDSFNNVVGGNGSFDAFF